MDRLPLTDLPLGDESLDSWIEYLASILGLQVAEVLETCGIDTTQTSGFTAGVSDDFALRLSVATGAPLATIHNATTRRFLSKSTVSGGEFGGLLIEGRTTRYCPGCLRDQPARWKLFWHLRTTLVCVKHQCVMLATCPRCGGRPRLNRNGSPQTLRTLNERKYSCSSPGCLPAMQSADAPSVSEAPAVIRAQEWFNSLLESEHYSLPSFPESSDPAKVILHDIAELITRHIDSCAWELDDQLCPSPGVRKTEEEISHLDTGEWPLREQLTAQTHLYHAFTARSARQARDHLSFLHPSVALMFCSRPPESDRKSLACMTTRRLLYPYYLRWRPTHRPWTPELMRTACVVPIPSSYLPSRCWPSMIDIAPRTTPRAAAILPLTTCLVLGMLGHDVSARHIARQVGLVLPDILVDRELADVFRGADFENILDHFVSLHSHLRKHPPPIDYDRRRQLFPSPATLYGPTQRRIPAHRYIWQLLTGGDPFAVTGTATTFGPIIGMYEAFVRDLTPEQTRALKQEAKRLLVHHGVRNEPLLYGPLLGTRGLRIPTADEITWLPVAKLILPGSHVSELTAPQRYIGPCDLVARAIDGDEMLARMLVAFVASVKNSDFSRDESLARVMEQVQDHLESMLGRRLTVEGRNRLTELGQHLIEEVERSAAALSRRHYDSLDGLT